MKNLMLIGIILFFFACSSDNTASDSSTKEVETVANPIKTTPENPIAQAKEEEKKETKKLTEDLKEATTHAEEPAKIKKEEPKKEKPKRKKKRAKISFEEKVFDFGDIRDGDIVKHDFKFKNIGNAPLNIKNVTATCGCTQPSFPFMPIEPGEEGIINVTFNSTGKINKQRPTVTVITNGRPSTIKLNLTGMVRQKL